MDTTWHNLFLAHLRLEPIVSRAARAAGVTPTTVQRHRKTLPAFEEQVQEALNEGVDRVEARAFEGATVGFEEVIIHQGQVQFRTRPEVDENGAVTYVLERDENGQPVPLTRRTVSTEMIKLVLKAKRKAEYADRQEITGADGGAISLDDTARAARVAQLVELARQRKAQQEAASGAANPDEAGFDLA